MNDMNVILSNLKSNKARDPHGFINELFSPGVIGSDLQLSLLQLLNKTKHEMRIPEFMKFINISSIYKNKNCKLDMNSYRGIFIVNCFRSILMKLIYQEYDISFQEKNTG